MTLANANRSDAVTPLFIATERFDPVDGEKWDKYFQWTKIPRLTEVVSLDSSLCPHIVQEFTDQDWNHIVREDFRLDYFYHLDHLQQRVRDVCRKNILGLYRNPETPITVPPAPGSFSFVGYDLVEEQTQISALTNCGGFPDVFKNDELNRYGLVGDFDRACEIRRHLSERHPEEPHAHCELYAIWRLEEACLSGISRLESPCYEGHSLTMLRRVAEILGATVRVTLAPKGESEPMILSETKIPYRTGKKS